MRVKVLAILFCGLYLGIAPRISEAEWIFEGYLGNSSTQNNDLRISQPAIGSRFSVKNVSFDDESFTSPVYYGARLGYFFSSWPWLGASFDFFHFKMIVETDESKRFVGTRNGAPIDIVQPVDTVVQGFAISHGVNYLTLNAIVRKGFFAEPERFPQGRLQGYAGVGPGVIVAHPENRIEGLKNKQAYEFGGVGVHAFLGARWMFFKHLGLFAEYKFTHSDLDVNLKVGNAKVNETTHHAVFGFSVPFLY